MLALAPVHTCTYVFRCLLQYLCTFNIQIQIYAFYVYTLKKRKVKARQGARKVLVSQLG